MPRLIDRREARKPIFPGTIPLIKIIILKGLTVSLGIISHTKLNNFFSHSLLRLEDVGDLGDNFEVSGSLVVESIQREGV